jgi:hypothetical protein
MKTPLLSPYGSPQSSKSSSPSPFSTSSSSSITGHHHHSQPFNVHHHYAPHRFSRSFILTLGVGITFGFSFAYLLLSVISWEKVDLIDSRPSYSSSQRLHARESETHDISHNHLHNDLDLSIRGPDYVFQPHDEDEHRGKFLDDISLFLSRRSLNFLIRLPSLKIVFFVIVHVILSLQFCMRRPIRFEKKDSLSCQR